MSAVNWDDDDQTELCHDDGGFVYRRKKRRRSDSEPSSAPPDPAQERAHWRRSALLKLRDRYQKEIQQWDFLSNSLRAMEDGAPRQPSLEEPDVGASGSGSPEPHELDSDPTKVVIDELLVKVEAQEAVMSHISNLCDVAESVCNELEEHWSNSFVDLSIWSSPQKLFSSLCTN